MTATNYTARNLDAYIGDVISIQAGEFMISPWGYKMPTTSSRFGLAGVPDGIYTIIEKNPESTENGSAVQYTIAAQQ